MRCSRYSFGPNRLHYCGPDANRELAGYIAEGASDPGLEKILGAFKTLYPYLKYIAHENGIRDPFDERVVEAYWIGNELLDNIERRKFYSHLLEAHSMRSRMSMQEREALAFKIESGAVPHHSFHVFNVWTHTGRVETGNTLTSMDECRISWGKVVSIDGPFIEVETEPLMLTGNLLALGSSARKRIARKLESEYEIEQLVPGDLISIHWSVPCEVITAKQQAALKKYTLRHLMLANRNLKLG